MLDYTENKYIDYIEERYFNRKDSLVRESVVYFKPETPVNEIFGYYNNNSATLAVLMEYHDYDYEDDFLDYETKIFEERQLATVYYSRGKTLPEIDLYFNSNGEKDIHIDSAAWDDIKLTKVLLEIDDTIEVQPETKYDKAELYDILLNDLKAIQEFNIGIDDYEVYLQKEGKEFEIMIEVISDFSMPTLDIHGLDTYFPVSLYVRTNRRFYRRGAYFEYTRSNPGKVNKLGYPEQVLYPLLGFTSSSKFFKDDNDYKINLGKPGVKTEVVNDKDPFTYDLTTGAMYNGSSFLWTEAQKFKDATKKLRVKLNLEEQ